MTNTNMNAYRMMMLVPASGSGRAHSIKELNLCDEVKCDGKFYRFTIKDGHIENDGTVFGKMIANEELLIKSGSFRYEIGRNNGMLYFY